MDLLRSNIADLNCLLEQSIGNSSLNLDADCICQIIWEEICSYIRNYVAPEFAICLELEEGIAQTLCDKNLLKNSTLQCKAIDKFYNCIKELKASFDELLSMLHKLNLKKYSKKDYGSDGALKDALREALLSQLPTNFNQVVYIFYRISFNLSNTQMNQVTDLSDSNCGVCGDEIEKCQCELKVSKINEVNRNLIDMGLLDRLAGQAMTSLVQERVKEHIVETCQGIFDRSHLKTLNDWLEDVVISWLHQVYSSGQQKVSIEATIDGFKVKLTYFLYETFAWSIIEQFFSIIIDFPDSIPAIEDLKICIEKIDIRKQLIKALKNSLEARVLHPGVNTIDILTTYVAAIKAIRHLDSSGVILETVTAPIRDYLRKRNDTVRRVVTGLTEEGPTDLSEELARGEALKENAEAATSTEFQDWEMWQPDPFGLEANTNGIANATTTNNRSADIISMVVDIYGTKELFMNEYRNLMADRISTQLDFNAEKEIRNLELLKIRFGEHLLHSCEVMLKDVTDSKRINAHIQGDANYGEAKQFELSALIVSAQFWPSFNKESLELPEEIAKEFEKYTKSFEAYKGNRTLNWRNVTGRVNISIEVGNRTVDMVVAPTQAVIIYHFQEKDTWSLDELSSVMKVPASILKRRIGFWLSNGFLKEISSGVFKLVEDNIDKMHLPKDASTQHMDDDDDIDSAMASATDQREEELQVFWSYIVGMLTNLNSLPIDRIHQMLKLFASHGLSVEFSQDDLKQFLQRKVREHKLIFAGGVYQLPK